MKRHLEQESHDNGQHIKHRIIDNIDTKENTTLYLDTINPHKIDFDFENICSISLSATNVYCCLVCGKYFQGRTKNSIAYRHSIDYTHNVFINMETGRIYALPENYEIKVNSNLTDRIKYNLNPTFTKEDIQLRTKKVSYDLNQNPYMAGFVGLNNFNCNDYSNVVIQLLAHLHDIRDYYLLNTQFNDTLNTKFGLLVRKLWNDKLLKNHVSPHDFLQEVSTLTNKKLSVIHQENPKTFLMWLLNHLKTPALDLLRGKLHITKVPLKSVTNTKSNKIEFIKQQPKVMESKFWMLTLDLPQVSFNDLKEKVPEVSLQDLLLKYNGTTEIQSANELKHYKVIELPQYLVLYIDRDMKDTADNKSKNNPTVVKFSGICDIGKLLFGETQCQMYKLVANISKEMSPEELSDRKVEWSISLRRADEWYNIRDLSVTPIQEEIMFLDESVIQVWEKQ